MPKIKWFYSYDLAIAAYLLLSLLLSHLFGFRVDYAVAFDLRLDLSMILMAVVSLLGLTLLAAFAKRLRGEDATLFGPAWRGSLRAEYLTAQHLYDLVRVLVALKLVLLIYCNIKQAIPRINPLLTDDILLRLDVMLHFGVNPMTTLVAWLGQPPVATWIDKLYVFWYAVKAPTLVFFIILPNRRLAERFFGAYFLLWMLGGLMAVLVPSLGPVYLHSEWFATVDKPIATALQHRLIVHYLQALESPQHYQVYIYEGVAAFPSLHVGVVALYAFFLWRVHRLLGIAMGVYALIIQIGSVLLGWHYAIDGYVASMLAFILYRVFTNDWPVALARSLRDAVRARSVRPGPSGAPPPASGGHDAPP